MRTLILLEIKRRVELNRYAICPSEVANHLCSTNKSQLAKDKAAVYRTKTGRR